MSSAKSLKPKTMEKVAESWEVEWEKNVPVFDQKVSSTEASKTMWDDEEVPHLPPVKEEEEQDVIIKRSKFDDMGINEELLRCIYNAGYQKPRTHQKSAIPTTIKLYKEALDKGKTARDILVCAPTSSGKTLSYVVSALNSIEKDTRATQVLIICKTRELAGEIYERVCSLVAPNADMPKDSAGKKKTSDVPDLYTVALHRGTFNKTSSEFPDTKRAQKYFTSARTASDIGNEQIIVATAGRCLDLLSNTVYVGREYERLFRQKARAEGITIPTNSRNFDHCSTTIRVDCLQELVMDEVDQLFDNNGNQSASTIYDIVEKIPEYTRLIMYSATLSQPIQFFAEERKAMYLEFKATEKSNSNIEHYYVTVRNEEQKLETMTQIVECFKTSGSVIIFTSSVNMLRTIYKELSSKNFAVVRIFGSMSQTARDTALNNFKNDECKIMVTTDLLARGIDIASVDLVVNYDLPDDDSRNYQHRAGRAGRAGIVGNCVTLIESNNNAVPPIITKFSKALAIHIDPLPISKLNIPDQGV